MKPATTSRKLVSVSLDEVNSCALEPDSPREPKTLDLSRAYFGTSPGASLGLNSSRGSVRVLILIGHEALFSTSSSRPTWSSGPLFTSVSRRSYLFGPCRFHRFLIGPVNTSQLPPQATHHLECQPWRRRTRRLSAGREARIDFEQVDRNGVRGRPLT